MSGLTDEKVFLFAVEILKTKECLMFFQACSLTCLDLRYVHVTEQPLIRWTSFSKAGSFLCCVYFELFGGCCHGDESCAPVWETAVEAVCDGSSETELWMYTVHKTHTGLQVKISWWKNSERKSVNAAGVKTLC